jgi:hypothetical protein
MIACGIKCWLRSRIVEDGPIHCLSESCQHFLPLRAASNPALRAATPPGLGSLLILAPLLLVEAEEFFGPEGDRFACESQRTGSAFAFEGE